MIMNSAGAGIAVGSLFRREWTWNSKQTLTAKKASHGRSIHRGRVVVRAGYAASSKAAGDMYPKAECRRSRL